MVSLRLDLLLRVEAGGWGEIREGLRVASRERRVSGRADRHSVAIFIAIHQ